VVNNIILLCARADAHAGVVYSIINEYKLFNIIGFLDDDERLLGTKVFDVDVIGKLSNINEMILRTDTQYFICTGNNSIRERYQLLIEKRGFTLANIIHPTAIISKNVKMGLGVFIGANVVINSGSNIGDGVVINTSATIDHDNMIEDYVNISPGSHTSGRVKIESGAFLGSGSIIIPDITVGRNAVVGAGSVVIANVKKSATVVGVPAREL